MKSICFFNDRDVKAVWDNGNYCWWFSATDVIRAINDEQDYTKAGNYWRWLKHNLKHLMEDIRLNIHNHCKHGRISCTGWGAIGILGFIK